MDVQKTTINALRILSADAVQKPQSTHSAFCPQTRYKKQTPDTPVFPLVARRSRTPFFKTF